MASRKCAVPGCTSRNGISKFMFPANETIGREWLRVINNDAVLGGLGYDEIREARYKVCLYHFTKTDWIPKGNGRQLFEWAIPSLNLPPPRTAENATVAGRVYYCCDKQAGQEKQCNFFRMEGVPATVEEAQHDLEPQPSTSAAHPSSERKRQSVENSPISAKISKRSQDGAIPATEQEGLPPAPSFTELFSQEVLRVYAKKKHLSAETSASLGAAIIDSAAKKYSSPSRSTPSTPTNSRPSTPSSISTISRPSTPSTPTTSRPSTPSSTSTISRPSTPSTPAASRPSISSTPTTSRSTTPSSRGSTPTSRAQ
ncbi:hypothetical protein QAD02_018027 [Eretmocerus hayati]|uniref:Uncharacterized protein n=1 Tax=Eretmocerus hayati TaxID=131215 RepID=A0ACC2PFN1_9HYME|nr:hypothetical protein QAD02_018027 [Eretmocerus hayati]